MLQDPRLVVRHDNIKILALSENVRYIDEISGLVLISLHLMLIRTFSAYHSWEHEIEEQSAEEPNFFCDRNTLADLYETG